MGPLIMKIIYLHKVQLVGELNNIEDCKGVLTKTFQNLCSGPGLSGGSNERWLETSINTLNNKHFSGLETGDANQ